MYKVKSPKNYRYPEDAYLEKQPKAMPSMTVPDNSYTLREIMEKFTRGQSISGMGSYNEFDPDGSEPEDYIPHPRTLDLVDRQELNEEYNKQAHHLKSKFNAPKPTGTNPRPETPEGDK